MVEIIILLICFGASVAGALCGIGGGVIIKPVLDAFGIMDVATISFLSGCTVLSMTTYSVLKSRIAKSGEVKIRTGLPLALGAATGGILGKYLFSIIQSLSSDKDQVGAVQATCLLFVTVGTLLYTIWKDKIHTMKLESVCCCVVIGIMLGILSSFLGIGGGPINLVIFYFFFSMSTKTAAENSLYVIFFSQLASLIQTLLTGNVPDFSGIVLILMITGGITGGMVGRAVNKKIKEKSVEKMFIALMIAIIFINIYNIYNIYRLI